VAEALEPNVRWQKLLGPPSVRFSHRGRTLTFDDASCGDPIVGLIENEEVLVLKDDASLNNAVLGEHAKMSNMGQKCESNPLQRGAQEKDGPKRGHFWISTIAQW
jgi:hypothetical protein